VVVPVNMVKLKFDPQTLPIDQTVTRLRLAACAGRKCVVTAEGCLPKDADLFVSLPVAVRSKAWVCSLSDLLGSLRAWIFVCCVCCVLCM